MPELLYQTVPKDPAANLAFREEQIRWGSQGPYYANKIKQACARDKLYWINTFLWIYEARPEAGDTAGRMLPFITYKFQDDVFRAYDKFVGHKDIHEEKSRDMGATWMVLTDFLWRWQFHGGAYLLVSRNQDLVDKKDNPDALFPKIRMMLRWQPKWLTPTLGKSHDTLLHLFNPETNSVIDGASTTSNTGVGGRRTAMFMDEFALVDEAAAMYSATRDITNSRIFVSTPLGENQFYRIRQVPSVENLSLHWSLHPDKAKGLYRVTKGKLEVIDGKYKFGDGYKFVTNGPFFFDGRLRSPWYDDQCLRASHPREIRTQLDIDYVGSAEQFFGQDVIDRQLAGVRDPLVTGELSWDDDMEKFTFSSTPSGRWKLWIPVDTNHKPLGINDGILIGADVSQGTGATPSTMHGRDAKTGTQMMSFIDPNIDPLEFGTLMVATCKWLGRARLAWEANGPGQSAGKSVTRLGYTKIYMNINIDKMGHQTPSQTPGWWSSPKSKHLLLNEYQAAMRCARVTERDSQLVKEMQQYVWTTTGIFHSGAMSDDDLSGAGVNHGDRVIGAALSKMLFGTKLSITKQEGSYKPGRFMPGTYGYLKQERERKALQEQDGLLEDASWRWR